MRPHSITSSATPARLTAQAPVQLWTGASWADIPERYGSHTLTASTEGAGSGFGTPSGTGDKAYDVYLSLEPWLHEFSTKPKIRSFAIAYTPAQIGRKEREPSNQFRWTLYPCNSGCPASSFRAPCLLHLTRVLVSPPTTPRTRWRTTCCLSMVVPPLALTLHKYWSRSS
jgi:hypothetical protein